MTPSAKPESRKAGGYVSLRVTAKDRQIIDDLMRRWGASQTGVLRTALVMAWAQETGKNK